MELIKLDPGMALLVPQVCNQERGLCYLMEKSRLYIGELLLYDVRPICYIIWLSDFERLFLLY